MLYVDVKDIERAYDIALVASYSSFDPVTKVGCSLFQVDNSRWELISVGCNNPVRSPGGEYADIPWTKPEKFEYVIHAEVKAILNRKVNIQPNVAYVTLSPCCNCIRLLYSIGVTFIWYKEKHKSLDNVLQMKDIDIKEYKSIDGHNLLILGSSSSIGIRSE
jgi:deoxycytidylate deaminase